MEAALYAYAERSTWVATFSDLNDLAQHLAWSRTIDYLSKVLRSLRDKGRIDYETQPGRKKHPYRIELLYRRDSEDGPISDVESGRCSEVAETQVDEPFLDVPRRLQSEQRQGGSAGISPSINRTSPSTSIGANPVCQGIPDSDLSDSFRAEGPLEDLEDQTKGSCSERQGFAESEGSRVATIESANRFLATFAALNAADRPQIVQETSDPAAERKAQADAQRRLEAVRGELAATTNPSHRASLESFIRELEISTRVHQSGATSRRRERTTGEQPS